MGAFVDTMSSESTSLRHSVWHSRHHGFVVHEALDSATTNYGTSPDIPAYLITRNHASPVSDVTRHIFILSQTSSGFDYRLPVAMYVKFGT